MFERFEGLDNEVQARISIKSDYAFELGNENNPTQLTVKQLKQIILGQKHVSSLIVSVGEMSVKSENNDKTVVNPENTPVSLNSAAFNNAVSDVKVPVESSSGGEP